MKNKVERFILKPSTQLFFGRTIHKNTQFDEYTDNKEVHQILKNCVLTTTIKKKFQVNGTKATENTTLKQYIRDGSVLIWTEENGYVLSEYNITTADKAIEDLTPLLEFSNSKEK